MNYRKQSNRGMVPIMGDSRAEADRSSQVGISPPFGSTGRKTARISPVTRRLHLIFATMAALSMAPQAIAQNDDRLGTELAVIESQIADVDAVIARYQGGLILSLAQARREALLLLRAVVEARLEAEASGIRPELTIPAVAPDPQRAQRLLGEMVAVQSRIEEAERDAAGAGGLVQALALSRLETERLSMAQLQMAWLQAEYGLAFPQFVEPGTSAPGPALRTAQPESTGQDVDDGTVAWADPNHPEIDYSIAPFELAHRDGHRISGWWVIQTEQAAIDDSPKITALNHSAYDGRSFGRPTTLVVRCHEGEAAVIFVQDDFLTTDFRRNTLDVTYRLDSAAAVQTRWSSLTSNTGAGVFRREAEAFIRSMYDARSFFIRVTDNRGRRVDATFDLAGGEAVFEAVAAACGFTTLSLSSDDYRAVQTLLNAGGYDAGTPDGVWGPGSQRAMRRFQAASGLPETGAPDRQTLEALGVGN